MTNYLEGKENLLACPLQENGECGWIFDYDFVRRIADISKNMEFPVGMEEVDIVLTILLDDNRIKAS